VFVLVASYACLLGALFEWLWNRWVNEGKPPTTIRRVIGHTGAVLAILVGILICLAGRGMPGVQALIAKAEQGNVQSQVKLAHMYWTGDVGARQNTERAMAWARRAANSGDVSAQFFLGWMCSCSETSNKAESIRWYRKAAEQGDMWGQYYTGVAYQRGCGTETNLAEAGRWYMAAAAQGCEPARAALDRLKAFEASQASKP
jgi:hypothetical protein